MNGREHVEAQVARIWASALGVEHVKTSDEFLALGGDSVAAVQIVVAMWSTFGIEVALDTLFEGHTVSTFVRSYFPPSSFGPDEE
jgi:acyl carrier protein